VFKLKNFSDIPKLKTKSALINAFGAAADVLIAAAMVYLLHTSRSDIKHSRSDSIIDRLVRLILCFPRLP
jgi:hypothetical protein